MKREGNNLLLELVKQLVFLTGYLSQNAFPQPLEEHDEAEWVKRLQKGDAEAKDVLIQHNLRLVAHIAKKFDNVAEDQDDLISIGTIGLIKAINTFNPGKKAKLGTYAARCIENEILMHIRAQRKHKCEVSLNEPIGTDSEGNQISLRDILGTDGDMVAEEVEQNCEYLNLLRHMHCLTGREQKVVAMRYGLDGTDALTQKEVGERLGVSRSYVSRIEKKALEKLMKAIKLRE
ncbi:MAG: RNA polymerase sporulation sigma factor SigK [Peptococcaceae bacterium]|mgnify:FL=1|jgi:RNA polymerase sporulation-specific sigma factor|nr:RNA polymerase sporulation sigma factor SigK [Peptococcaceae bacterium]